MLGHRPHQAEKDFEFPFAHSAKMLGRWSVHSTPVASLGKVNLRWGTQLLKAAHLTETMMAFRSERYRLRLDHPLMAAHLETNLADPTAVA